MHHALLLHRTLDLHDLKTAVDIVTMDETVAVARIAELAPIYCTHYATMLKVNDEWKAGSYIYHIDDYKE